MDYCEVVLSLLKEKKYPILEGFVVLDLYYKLIPEDVEPTSIRYYDDRLDNPEDTYVRDRPPFVFCYMISLTEHRYALCEIKQLDTNSLEEQCRSIRLDRSFLDKHVFHKASATFEEELYEFIKRINFDVPRIRDVLNFTFLTSTRVLPQRIRLWIYKYTIKAITDSPVSSAERGRFGPPAADIIPTRVLLGRLSECTSHSRLLSLNDNVHCPSLKYTDHYAVQWKSIVPLAFNPLENPIIVSNSAFDCEP